MAVVVVVMQNELVDMMKAQEQDEGFAFVGGDYG